MVTFGLLFIVLVPGLGVHAEGSSRWVGFGQLRMQPSELMKLALTLFAADFVARRIDEDSADRRIIGPLLIVTGFACVLILAQPDMGTATVLGCITLSLLFVSGVRLRPVMKIVGILVALGLVVALVSPYRRARLLSFIDPSAHGSSSGYQVVQSLIGLGSGHLFGTGLGRGQQQWGFLPNAHTDFIFSVIGEELGILGACLVLVLLGSLLWLGVRAATPLSRSLRRSSRDRDRGLDRGRDTDQHRSSRRRASRHRHSPSVHLVRGILSRDHHGGGRGLGEHRPAGGVARTGRVGAGSSAGRLPSAPPSGVDPSFRWSRTGSVRSRRDVVIAGGGTGGHIVPSLQIARELVAQGRDPENIELYGSKRGQEAGIWPKLEFPHTLLSGRGIRRSMEPSSIVANVGAIAGVAWACARAFGSFLVRRPRVVVIVGGYASFPAGLAAVLTRVPLVSMTTDSVPGVVNRFLGRFAVANAVAFESGELPRSQVTGTPVRPELHPLDRSHLGIVRRPNAARATT